jgi:chromosomal replication initiation ATPase DnaA
MCVKNITLSADEKLIEAARKKARASNRTLNDEFRRWLEAYTTADDRAAEAEAVMEQIASYAGTGGRTFSRDEMNER